MFSIFNLFKARSTSSWTTLTSTWRRRRASSSPCSTSMKYSQYSFCKNILLNQYATFFSNSVKMSCLTLRIYSAILCTRILLNLNGYFYKFSNSMKSTIPHLFFMMMNILLHFLPPPGISTTRSLCRSRTRCWRSTRSGRSGSSPRRT